MDGTSPTSLTEAERAAIVDLMIAAMHTNGTLKLSENSAFNRLAPRVGWSLERVRDRFATVVRTIGKQVREPEGQAEFIADCGLRLASEPARALAIRGCNEIVGADGARSENERAFLDRVLRALGQ